MSQATGFKSYGHNASMKSHALKWNTPSACRRIENRHWPSVVQTAMLFLPTIPFPVHQALLLECSTVSVSVFAEPQTGPE